MSSLSLLAGRPLVMVWVDKVYSVEERADRVVLVCDMRVDRPLTATEDAEEKVSCFPSGYQNMKTQCKKVRLEVLQDEHYRLPQYAKAKVGGKYFIGAGNDTMTFANGVLVSMSCSGGLRESAD